MITHKKAQHLKTTPLISVIVPIYKVEVYLKRCIDSILEQDYKNLQIILVDDGSPDKCPAICNNYARQDKRIIVIHKANGGLSDARNAGIEVAKGEYIAFVDSDDYIDKEFISQLYYLIYKYKADISVCEWTAVYDNSREVRKRSNTYDEVLLTNIEAMKDLITDHKYGHVFAWNKLYKASIFFDNMIRYPKGKIFEDAITTFKLFYYANKIVYRNQPLYYYLKRSDSITAREDGAINARTKLEFLDEMDLFIHDHDLPLTKESNANTLITTLHYIGLLTGAGNANKAYWNQLRTIVVSNFPKCLMNNKLPISKKIATIVIWLGRIPYIFVSKIIIFVGYSKRTKKYNF